MDDFKFAILFFPYYLNISFSGTTLNYIFILVFCKYCFHHKIYMINCTHENKEKQIFVAVAVFILLNVLFISAAYLIRAKLENENVQANETEIAVEDNNIMFPKLVNQNPSVAYVGEKYSFFPKIVDSDTPSSEIEVSLKSAPILAIL
jgi:hypothetical protein